MNAELKVIALELLDKWEVSRQDWIADTLSGREAIESTDALADEVGAFRRRIHEGAPSAPSGAKKIDGGRAFPRPMSEDRKNGDLPDGNEMVPEQEGMSLRAWFAGKALVVILSNPPIVQACVDVANNHRVPAPAIVAETAVRYADAMLEALAVPARERAGG